MSMHELHDKKSLELHRLIAKKLMENPDLLSVAIANLSKLKDKHSNSRANDEWELILMGSIEFICKYICEESENATKLRQSSPFIGILTQQERKSIYEKVFAGALDSISR
jgi:hypothetical protein